MSTKKSVEPIHNLISGYGMKSERKKKRKSRHKSSRRSSKSSSSNNSKSSSTKSSQHDSYEVLDTVGYGSFAKVSRVRRKSSEEIFVWKELSYGLMSDKEKQMLCDEVNILRDLNHPNIVQFVDRIIDHQRRKIYIVQEFCDGGDLASYIKLKKEKVPKMSGRISETFIWSVTSEIASALQHCHNHFNRHNAKKNTKKRILHRDLKPGNVFLVKRNGTYTVKLGDFGLAKMLDASSLFAQTHVGTPYYMSPEQIQSKSYNEKSDIWSLGCIVYEMAMLSPPFKASNYLHLAEKIKLGIYKKVSSRNYSEELESAIAMMLKIDSHERAKVEELLCLQRIQFTSKMQRLDRRYFQLKKKERQFNLRMKEVENKYKQKANELKKKETELKLKETELKLKEKEIFLSSSSTASKSPHAHAHAHTNDTKSDESSNSNSRDKSLNNLSNMPISPLISSFKRATSNASNYTMTTPSISEEIDNEQKEQSPVNSLCDRTEDCLMSYNNTPSKKSLQSTPPSSLQLQLAGDRGDSNSSFCTDNGTIEGTADNGSGTGTGNGNGKEAGDIMKDARKFLMKRINLNDLAENIGFRNKNEINDYNYLTVNNSNA